jgi:hypothetical protein
VDLDYLDYLAELTAPSQPPPLVAAMLCGDECDVTTVVPGHELTAEALALRAVIILKDRGQRQQLDGADGADGPAANLLAPRSGDDHHRAGTSQTTSALTRPDPPANLDRRLRTPASPTRSTSPRWSQPDIHI